MQFHDMRTFAPRPFSHVIFDFDGTLSWLRHGWPGIMYDLFRGHYPARPGESEKVIHDLLISEILSLNGKPSVFQMIQFHQRVEQRAADCPSADALLATYQERLD